MEELIRFIPVTLFLISLVSWALVTPKKIQQLTEQQKVYRLREEIYKLFLLAEKQGWPGKEKMAWAIEKVNSSYYGSMILTLTGRPVDKFLQDLYVEFMESLAETALSLDNKKKESEETASQ